MSSGGGRTPAEIADLLSKARTLFDRIPRVQKTAQLVGSGFAFGELRLTARSPSQDVRTATIVAPRELLRQLGIDLYVVGTASTAVTVNSYVTLAAGSDCEFSYKEHYAEDQPPGHLWSDAINFDAIMSGMGPTISGVDLLSSLLPSKLLSQSAVSVGAMEVINDLFMYQFTVKQMKEAFATQLYHCLRQRVQDVLDITWTPEWDKSYIGSGFAVTNMGHIYQAFKQEGIWLQQIRNEATEVAREAVRAGLIARSTAREIEASFGA